MRGIQEEEDGHDVRKAAVALRPPASLGPRREARDIPVFLTTSGADVVPDGISNTVRPLGAQVPSDYTCTARIRHIAGSVFLLGLAAAARAPSDTCLRAFVAPIIHWWWLGTSTRALVS